MKRLILTFAAICFAVALHAQDDQATVVTLRVGDAAMTVDPARGGKILSLKHQEQEVLSQSRFPESFGSIRSRRSAAISKFILKLASSAR